MIKFRIDPKLEGVCPPPTRAAEFMPEWIKQIPKEFENNGNYPVPSVKACAPLTESFTTGYIIPLAASVYVDAKEEGMQISWRPGLDFNVAEAHYPEQVQGSGWTNVQKWLNPWLIETPPGYSCLITAPLNHTLPFQILSAVVDTDNYPVSTNFPFRWTQVPFKGHLERGTPVAQVIPFKREDWSMDVRAHTDEERAEYEKKSQLIIAEHAYYKKHSWVKKHWAAGRPVEADDQAEAAGCPMRGFDEGSWADEPT